MAHLDTAPDDREIVAFDARTWRECVHRRRAAAARLHRDSRQRGDVSEDAAGGGTAYRVVGLEGGEAIEVMTVEEPFNIHFVQPLGEKLLLGDGIEHLLVEAPFRGTDVADPLEELVEVIGLTASGRVPEPLVVHGEAL